MATKTYTNVEIIAVANSEVRNAAFAKGINRDVNLANAKKICADIKAHGYRQAELIQVLPAGQAVVKGDLTLVDINDNIITSENAQHYYLVLDGQHRIFATSLHNGEKDAVAIQVEKARAFDPFGHAGLTPLGKIRLTLADEIKMTPVEASAGEFFCSFETPCPGTVGINLKNYRI